MAEVEIANIAFADVSYRIDRTAIINNLTFRSDCRRIGVVGRNGSGKSTFARLLCGLVAPTTGTVTVAGIDVATDRYHAIQTVGMLFQNPDHQIIFPTVEEELVFGLKQAGQTSAQAKKAAGSLLDRFNCSTWAAKSVSTLSQGQRHLVCLMAVLLMNPRVIVLDEPYAGLDIPTTMQLKAYLSDVDASIVHISHDPDMLRAYDHIVWIEEGKIVREGAPAETLLAFCQQMEQWGQAHAIV